RRHLPGRHDARARRRLCRGPEPRPPHERNGALRVAAGRVRLREALERHLLQRRTAGARCGAHHRHGGGGAVAGARGSDPGADVRPSSRLTTVLVLTAAFMVGEVVGGLVSGSLALLADAGHMLTDVAALGLAVMSQRLA